MCTKSQISLAYAQEWAYQIFQAINEKHAQPWSAFVVMTDLLEEAGEVAAVVKGLEGYKFPNNPPTKAMLAMELADLFYCLCVLAGMYEINRTDTFLTTVNDYKTRFSESARGSLAS